jgi:hypothetical protein
MAIKYSWRLKDDDSYVGEVFDTRAKAEEDAYMNLVEEDSINDIEIVELEKLDVDRICDNIIDVDSLLDTLDLRLNEFIDLDDTFFNIKDRKGEGYVKAVDSLNVMIHKWVNEFVEYGEIYITKEDAESLKEEEEDSEDDIKVGRETLEDDDEIDDAE